MTPTQMNAASVGQRVRAHKLRATIWIAAALAALAALPLVLSSYQTSIATQVLIFSVLAMSIDILAGYAGRTSLGHGAIFGVSTYVAIYWTSSIGGDLWIGIALGILAATALSAVFGLLAVRTSGVYFLLLTLALGMIVWGVCLRWTNVTGGENGLRGIGRPDFIADDKSFYYAVLIVVSLSTFVMWRFVHSPFGLALRGIRDSESRMRSLGYNVSLHLFLAFLMSGLFAGIAGALYMLFNNFVSPSTVELSQSVSGLLMAVTGGVGTLFGSFVGAAAIIVLENVVSTFTARWPTILGLTFVLIMIFAPEGLVGRARILFARRVQGARWKDK
ncbi:MAG TPA: branched-chain amino acid ABC transporter permease [Methylovirgula sp.]